MLYKQILFRKYMYNEKKLHLFKRCNGKGGSIHVIHYIYYQASFHVSRYCIVSFNLQLDTVKNVISHYSCSTH